MQNRKATPCVVVACIVVAVPSVAAAHNDPIGPPLERLHDEERANTTAAGQAENAHVGRHLQAAGASQIGSRVGAPVAHKS